MIRKVFILYIFTFALFSCVSDLSENQIIGKWCLVSIDSKINGEEFVEPIYPTVGEVVYEFRCDSTYTLNDMESVETGKWILENDSLLGLSAVINKDNISDTLDSLNTENYLWMTITNINDSIMSLCNTVGTDYGVVEEIYLYKKCLNR
jgi:hypothetical protein